MVRAVEILFVTTELAPYSVRVRAPEVGETAASLPKALRGLGHRVTVVSPLYKSIDPAARSLARRLSTVSVEVRGRTYTCTLYDGRTTGGVDLIFLGHAELFGERPGPDGDADTLLRSSLVLSGAAAQLACTRDPRVEVLHAHGSGSALTLALAKAVRPELACTISLLDPHDPLAIDPSQLDELAGTGPLKAAIGSAPNLLAAGVRAADAVVASSASSASELLADSQSALAPLLRDKGPRFVGIVNGVDASIWNPLIDSHLSARFDATNLSGKLRCKGSLQYMLGLGVNPDLPLVLAIGELSEARGGDLIAEIAHDCLRNEVQICVLGTEGPAAERLQALSTEFPERLALRTSHDDKERHLALGGSDFLLLPAREPRSVEIALSGLRYGALPIVRPVGALADVVVDADAKLETGNGFVTESTDATELLATVQRALGAYAKRSAFEALRKSAMRQDVSWERSARRYEHLFKQILQVNAPAA
jgi:starch synthase